MHAAWHICTIACPSKASCAVFFLRSHGFASFAFSLSFLHYPALLVLVHALSHCDSWLLNCLALVESGEKLRLALSLLGTTEHCLSLCPCGTGCVLTVPLSAWLPDIQEVTVTRKSPLPNSPDLLGNPLPLKIKKIDKICIYFISPYK